MYNVSWGHRIGDRKVDAAGFADVKSIHIEGGKLIVIIDEEGKLRHEESTTGVDSICITTVEHDKAVTRKKLEEQSRLNQPITKKEFAEGLGAKLIEQVQVKSFGKIEIVTNPFNEGPTNGLQQV